MTAEIKKKIANTTISTKGVMTNTINENPVYQLFNRPAATPTPAPKPANARMTDADPTTREKGSANPDGTATACP